VGEFSFGVGTLLTQRSVADRVSDPIVPSADTLAWIQKCSGSKKRWSVGLTASISVVPTEPCLPLWRRMEVLKSGEGRKWSNPNPVVSFSSDDRLFPSPFYECRLSMSCLGSQGETSSEGGSEGPTAVPKKESLYALKRELAEVRRLARLDAHFEKMEPMERANQELKYTRGRCSFCC